ncbi:hypothetical protein LINGRAHAP2_LOCUS11225 [Linum grandiflorum]
MVDFTDDNGNLVTVIGVYFSCDFHTRNQQLHFITNVCCHLDHPFIICGDFNTILLHSEKNSHTSNTNTNRSIETFQNFINNLALTDLFPSGPLHTWSNRQAIEVKCRLDRLLLSDRWISLYPQSSAFNLSDNGSAHRAILYSSSTQHSGPKKYFSFDQRWLCNPEANRIITDTWTVVNPLGSKLYKINHKLNILRQCLVEWQRIGSSNSARRIQSLKSSLACAKQAFRPNWDEIREIERHIEHELRLEDRYWKRKARNRWLVQGERNTKYYHRIANSHKSKNYIHKLQDSNGISQADEYSKQSFATQYFQQLFSSDLPPGFFPSNLCPNFAKHVHPEANNNLVRYVSDSEIRNATFSIGINQAPGADGFSSCFFRHH